MLELTFDPDARTIYAYFSEIDEGDDAAQIECEGEFLLDDAGQIVGMRVAAAGLTPADFAAATAHPEARFDEALSELRLVFSPDEPTGATAFPYPAIIDRDQRGGALGIEFIADPEFAIEGRLARLQPFIVEVFGSADEGAAFDMDSFFGGSTTTIAAPIAAEDAAADDAETAEAAASDAPAEAAASDAPAEDRAMFIGDDAVPPAMNSDELVRAGFVALVGKPNVGKSTLLNAYFGAKVSIVSPKPQTTRIAVRGIVNRPDAQVIFVDTPGLHNPKSRLGEFMVEAARRAIPNADVVCFVVDASEPPDSQDRAIAETIKASGKPAILVLNKMDLARHADETLVRYRELAEWTMEVAVAAKDGKGIAGLLDQIVLRLPESPRLFPPDQYTDLSEREQVAELVREKVLLNTQQEVPHGVAVEVEEWAERGDRLYIRATVNVEREGHKGIIIGDRGQMLKKIGAAARYEIERLLQRPIFLDLWVKVRKDWRSDPASLRWLGYDIKKLKK